ncbi:putative alternative large T antigen [Rousettus aegyptiacus polyomavirus 1]|uniref:Putative alternative large T antigen n=1 Tax=Rousettus aegyptiacus polyomavirus 1 TaxID=1904411 RepID=A0A1S7J029_9POLY|nr:putative alternative large T antigen [Rousettus aegyptiacus polyomavirus 1]BAX01894.1 putative alternative large T antigen [Rousettus aegyptiacus polyomavirus 1]
MGHQNGINGGLTLMTCSAMNIFLQMKRNPLHFRRENHHHQSLHKQHRQKRRKLHPPKIFLKTFSPS